MIKPLPLLFLATLFSLYPPSLLAAEIAGRVELIDGKVWIQGADNKMRAISTEQPIFEGDTIITGNDGELQVRMKDDAFIAVRANSKLKIDIYRAEGDADDKATFSLLLGTFRSVTGWIGKYNRNNYSINTRTATIGVRGTDHEPMYIPPAVPGMPPIGEPGVYDKVNSGRIVIKNQFGETEFDKGQAAFVGLNSRQAAVRLQGIPDFFKPSRHEQRIEDARNNLQMGIEKSLIKRQQERKSEGISPRPLLRPQLPHDGGLAPETKAVTPDEKSDHTLLPGKRPVSPTRDIQTITPVMPQKLSPEIAPILPQKLPDMPTRLTPVDPASIKSFPTQQLTPIAPIAPASKLTPTVIQPQPAIAIDAVKLQQPIISSPTLASPVAPALLSPQAIQLPATNTNEKTAEEEQLNTTNNLVAPTLLQQPTSTRILLPAK